MNDSPRTPEEIEIGEIMLAQHDEDGASWPFIADKWKVTAPTARRMALGYPIGPKVRKQLGLTVMLPAPACVKCGAVHTTKNCQAGRTRNLPPWVNEAVDNLMMLRQRKLEGDST